MGYIFNILSTIYEKPTKRKLSPPHIGIVENTYLIQNSQVVKKECGPEKGYGEKRCEIQGGSQEMAVMVG